MQLAADDPRGRRWRLLLLRGGCATPLDALDRHEASGAKRTLQGWGTFEATWTFRRSLAGDHAITLVNDLAVDLPRDVVQSARQHLRSSAAIEVTDVEARLVVAAKHLAATRRDHQRPRSRRPAARCPGPHQPGVRRPQAGRQPRPG